MVRPAKIVEHIEDCQDVAVATQLLGVGVCGPGVPADSHPRCQVVAFDIRRADVPKIRESGNDSALRAGVVAVLVLFDELPVINLRAEDLLYRWGIGQPPVRCQHNPLG